MSAQYKASDSGDLGVTHLARNSYLIMSPYRPWIPSLDGVPLTPHPWLLQANKWFPDENEPQWAYKSVREAAKGNHTVIPPMWQCVVTLWRLRCRIDVYTPDHLWKQHVVAQLVR